MKSPGATGPTYLIDTAGPATSASEPLYAPLPRGTRRRSSRRHPPGSARGSQPATPRRQSGMTFCSVRRMRATPLSVSASLRWPDQIGPRSCRARETAATRRAVSAGTGAPASPCCRATDPRSRVLLRSGESKSSDGRSSSILMPSSCAGGQRDHTIAREVSGVRD